jgi:hypothetical protein
MEDSEFLKRLDISDADLTDYLAKFAQFHASLNDAQKAFAARTTVTNNLEEAASALGDDVKPENYQKFLQVRSGQAASASFMAPCE